MGGSEKKSLKIVGRHRTEVSHRPKTVTSFNFLEPPDSLPSNCANCASNTGHFHWSALLDANLRSCYRLCRNDTNLRKTFAVSVSVASDRHGRAILPIAGSSLWRILGLLRARRRLIALESARCSTWRPN